MVYRQGDVMLFPVDRKTGRAVKQWVEDYSAVLAAGRTSGNPHTLEGLFDLYENENGDRFAEVVEECELKHPEHAALKVEPGLYRVIRQQVYDGRGGTRIVID